MSYKGVRYIRSQNGIVEKIKIKLLNINNYFNLVALQSFYMTKKNCGCGLFY